MVETVKTPTVGLGMTGTTLTTLWPLVDIWRLLSMLEGPKEHRQVAQVCSSLCSKSGWRETYGDKTWGVTGESSANAFAELWHSVKSAETLAVEVSDAKTQNYAAEAKEEGAAFTAALPEWWTNPSLQHSMASLAKLEKEMVAEQRYFFGPDWELKNPKELVSKKGTWLKQSTQFSWEIAESQKLYMPPGVVMPVLQFSRVHDKFERSRHEWGDQHLRCWLKPTIVSALEKRRFTWFVYWPHWVEVSDTVLVADGDTWLKRNCGMSKELQPFELIYIPRGFRLVLAERASAVKEPWEIKRHPFVHEHRQLMLPRALPTIRGEKYHVVIDSHERP